MSSVRSSVRLRRSVLAVVLTTGILVVPVATAEVASAAPCPTVPLPIPIPLPCIVPPAATTPPTITGVAKVGETLSAVAPTWDQPDITTTYQWTRDGEDIAEATMPTYALTGDDFDAEIAVTARGTNPLGLPGSSSSAPVFPEKGDPIEAVTAPVVTGTPRVGGSLTTTSGTWGEPEPTFTYQWYRSRPSGSGASIISGATSTTYSPTVEDTGRKLIVLVVADRFGFEKGTALSNVASVPKAASTVALTLPKARVKNTERAGVRIVLGSAADLVPTGVVSILDGTRKIASITLGPAGGGVATLRLRQLARGTHRLSAAYAGDGAHQASRSSVAVLTVSR